MKYIFLFIILNLFSFSTYSQSGLTQYSDLIAIDSRYETIRSNVDELEELNLSGFWMNNESERRLGFIGKNYRRLHIKFLSIIKNQQQLSQYFVYGKSKVYDNVCPFQGVMTIKESYYIKSEDNPSGRAGILAGEYVFYENPESGHPGIFRGRFVTYWYKDKEGVIRYDDLWRVSAMYNNNQFAGTWTGYEGEQVLKANWGDDRIPESDEMDTGTSEFAVSERYEKYGWESFMQLMKGNVSKEERQKAGEEEAKVWWE